MAQSILSKFIKPNAPVNKIRVWLGVSTLSIGGLIILGGYTRLTHSGLSMVRWRLEESKWPSTQESWQEEFELYKQSPEFKYKNPDMNLEEFKFIFRNEWLHRQLARSIGVWTITPLPLLWKYFQPAFKLRMLGFSGLICLQGVVGWWMVKSGIQWEEMDLNGRVRVSPYRLSTHLTLGFTTFSMGIWQLLNIMPSSVQNLQPLQIASMKVLRPWMLATVLAIPFTTFLGSLVAGNDAGRIYNNYPFMGQNYLLPEEAFDIEPTWRNFCENPALTQFNHRNFAHLSYLLTLGSYLAQRHLPHLPKRSRIGIQILFLMVNWQLISGIWALMTAVPVDKGVIHQTSAVLTLSCMLFAAHALRIPK